jgi:FkbM family methyltransferase
MRANSAALVVYHVGGRDGWGPFWLPAKIAADSPIVFFEADSEAVAGMGSGIRPTIAVDKCVAKSSGRANFNITAKPHGSSLRVFDPRYAQGYVSTNSEDRVWGTTFRVVRTVEVETDSLDAVVEFGQQGLPAPDVLTLDTEGTEYEILEGASKLLQQQIVCVVAEVAFLPVRQGQKVYGDVAELLARHNFMPVQLQQHALEMSLYRAPIGLRGKGLQVFADAVFLKDPAAVGANRAASDAPIELRKLAIAALAFGQLEYALDCLERARQIGLPSVTKRPPYWTFLDQLEQCAAGVEPRYLPVAGEIDPCVPTAAQKGGGAAPAGAKNRIRRNLANHPRLRSAIGRQIERLERGRQAIRYLRGKYFAARSPVERLLRDHGFVELSDHVRELRLRQSHGAREGTTSTPRQ